MKYPIGIQDFESIISGNYVYVDKTALVETPNFIYIFEFKLDGTAEIIVHEQSNALEMFFGAVPTLYAESPFTRFTYL